MSFATVYSAVLSLNSHIHQIIKNQEKQMAVLDDLNTAVTALANNFASLDAAIQREIAALKLALSANDPTTIAAVTQKISDISTQMSADAQSLAASVPAPTPAPPATPAPSNDPVTTPENTPATS